MKKKFENALRAQVKDFGLSDKAIVALVEQGSALIADDATEEMVTNQANFFTNIAKAMQGEVTRKVQESKQQPTEPKDKGGDNTPQPTPPVPNGGSQHQQFTQGLDTLQKQLTEISKQLSDLTKANAEAQAKQAENARKAIVTQAAQKAGINVNQLHLYDTSKLSTAEEADKFFAEVKQVQVNNNLPRQGADVVMQGTSDQALADAAKAWANNLPDKK